MTIDQLKKALSSQIKSLKNFELEAPNSSKYQKGVWAGGIIGLERALNLIEKLNEEIKTMDKGELLAELWEEVVNTAKSRPAFLDYDLCEFKIGEIQKEGRKDGRALQAIRMLAIFKEHNYEPGKDNG